MDQKEIGECKEPQYRKTGKKLKNENLLMKGSVGGRGGGAKSCVTELDANFGSTPGQIHLSDIKRENVKNDSHCNVLVDSIYRISIVDNKHLLLSVEEHTSHKHRT